MGGYIHPAGTGVLSAFTVLGQENGGPKKDKRVILAGSSKIRIILNQQTQWFVAVDMDISLLGHPMQTQLLFCSSLV